ncbi:adenylate kinase isoenzyme 6 [Nomia melanderi]|uniref:adenylate kinase isoenzyme 6 n=1 Tax=Nomia melanderi TaxID=2448451 RepID=UPI001303F531|nr:adenylate kinase isoenzyme 6 [Nomia melanderi]XP_031832573.1 adenylate kinase isoenzyme 6 [Nomia melanderi]XP_031832574.1 adenylate kinase isoenzyme 6 [Nomia melanderi]XP_031832575.1 adenylate kinase isoenzyme 6 [Nomia melanderi]
MVNMNKSYPNILVTGTPGVGKSLMCRLLSERTGLTWIDVSKFAIENKCLEEYDDVYQCPILDEDKLLDHMEELMCEGGKIIDYHGADFFPERWFDIVFVLRTDNTILYDRLKDRGYTGKKLEDNIDCEIFQTILEEAKSAYREEIVHELMSNNVNQVTSNVDRICQWIEQWKIDNEQ